TAVDIVNAPLAEMADLTELFGGQEWMAEEATERDFTAIKRAQKRLRDVFEHGSAGRDAAAVEELNALLDAYPIKPRISGHDAPAGAVGAGTDGVGARPARQPLTVS